MRSEFFALANANETQQRYAKWNERTQARKRREQMAQVNLEIVSIAPDRRERIVCFPPQNHIKMRPAPANSSAGAGRFSMQLFCYILTVSPALIVMTSPLFSTQMSVAVGLKTMCPSALVRSWRLAFR